MKTIDNKTPKIIGAVVISAALIIGVYVFILSGEEDEGVQTSTVQTVITDNNETKTPADNSETTSPQSTSNDTSQNQTETTTSNSEYIDGTYSAKISYSVPKGHTNTLSVTMTVENDTITSIQTSSDYQDHESAEYTDAFDAKINGTVEGEPIADAFVGRIGGASLTSSAFNSALRKILNEAKS